MSLYLSPWPHHIHYPGTQPGGELCSEFLFSVYYCSGQRKEQRKKKTKNPIRYLQRLPSNWSSTCWAVGWELLTTNPYMLITCFHKPSQINSYNLHVSN
jgi:hypothetical protein